MTPKFPGKIVAVALAAAAIALSPLHGHAADSAAFTDAQKKALDQAIHDYIMSNPRVLMESVQKYHDGAEEAQASAFDQVIKQSHKELYNDPDSPVIGNKNGDVTLVEFFDYNCGYCKQAFKDIQTLVDKDKKLKVVFKDIPILAESSYTAAQYALAAEKQGKYWEFHVAMMQNHGAISEELLQTVAKSIPGMDMEKLKTDAHDPKIRGIIESNLSLAHDIGINGTPGFVIGDTALRGNYGLQALEAQIADTRAKKGG